MHRAVIIAALSVSLLAACGPGPAGVGGKAEAMRQCGPVSGAEYCDVRFGMDVEQAVEKFNEPLVRFAGDLTHDPGRCFEMYANGALEGVSFMVEGGKVGRIDVTIPGPATKDGFGVGSAEADIRAKLGDKVEQAPHKYEDGVIELSYPDRGGKVMFEVAAGKVRALRAGVAPMVDYVERCG